MMRNDDRLDCKGLTMFLAILAGSAAGTPAPANGAGASNCTQTSRAQREACGHEAEDDSWTQLAICHNIGNRASRNRCRSEATSARAEALELCSDQLEARLELCDALGESRYNPRVVPANFVDPSQIGSSVEPNPFFPLIPGRTWIYEGGDETITVTVTRETKVIQGVTCVVVKDVVKENGVLIEDTDDWFAQDVSGNVWYFGESTRDFEDGELVSIDGSFKAGVDGAKSGTAMKAAPEVGEVYRQEFALGDAEDVAEVLSMTGSATVPAASCNGTCLVTKDYTPISPDAIEHKYYAPGVGMILELDPESGARVELVEVRTD